MECRIVRQSPERLSITLASSYALDDLENLTCFFIAQRLDRLVQRFFGRLHLYLLTIPLNTCILDIELPSAQVVKKCLRLLQVFRIKPFSEPVVNLRQHLSGFVLLALLLPQTRKAG